MESEKKLPHVAIGLPVYNEAKHITEALDSILSQSYSNFTIYIADNCSDDGTVEICQSYCSKDRRIKYFRNATNIGSAANFQRVVELAEPDSPEYFMFARGDAVLSSNLLNKCVKTLEENRDAALAFASTEWIDHDGKSIEDKPAGYYDTRGCEVEFRVAMLLWGKFHYIYGLTRYTVMKTLKGKPWWQMIGADTILLLEQALRGSFYHVPGETWYRRYKYAGETYQDRFKRYRKHLLRHKNILDYLLPLAKMPYYLLRVVIESELSFSTKVKLILIILFSAPLRYMVSRGKPV